MVAAPDRLSPATRTLVVAADTELLFSAASAWEIAIKYTLGKLTLPAAPAAFVPRLMTRLGVTPLPVRHEHALHVAGLPQRHRDPFDRLLVAQAQLERVSIVTPDQAFDLYDVEVVRA
jgi:PIN domain nuclease of toxin-antitoxin system